MGGRERGAAGAGRRLGCLGLRWGRDGGDREGRRVREGDRDGRDRGGGQKQKREGLVSTMSRPQRLHPLEQLFLNSGAGAKRGIDPVRGAMQLENAKE